MTPIMWIESIWRWRVVFMIVIGAGLCALGCLYRLLPASYQGVSQVLMVNENTGRDPSVSSIDLPNLAISSAVLERVQRDVHYAQTVLHLKKTIQARVMQHSSMMSIAYSDSSADLAVSVPNAVADELSRYYKELSAVRYSQTTAQLGALKQRQKVKLDSLQRQLQAAVSTGSFSGSVQAIDNFSAHLADLRTQEALAVAALQADGASLSSLSEQPPAIVRLVRHETLQSDPRYTTLAMRSADDFASLKMHQAAFTAHYPGLPGEEHKVDAENNSLNSEASKAPGLPSTYSASAAQQAIDLQKARTAVVADRSKVLALESLIASEVRAVSAVPSSGSDVSVLIAERDAAQSEYQTLADRLATALGNQAEAASMGTVVVVDRALKADAQHTAHGPLWFVGFLASLALGFGAVYALETLDPRLTRAWQLEKLYGRPVIATFESRS